MAFPSTFLDIQNEVIAKIRLDATADLQKVKDWINQVQTEVCVETEALQTFATMTLTAGTNIYTLDSSIARIKEMYVVPVNGTASLPIEPVSIEEMISLTSGQTTGQPNTGGANRYCVFGLNDIQFYPTPSSADTVTVYYVKSPTVLSGNTDVSSIPEPYASTCLVNGTCYEAAIFAGDPGAQGFKQDYEMSKRNLRGHLRRKSGSYTKHFRLTGYSNYPPHDPSVDIR
jgi:hypothetical protein